MWQKSFTGEFAVSIDEANSWSTESLVPQQTAELELPDLQPLSLPIRVSKLTTTVSGFVFPEAQQWLPPTENRSEESRVKKKKKPVDRGEKLLSHQAAQRRHQTSRPTVLPVAAPIGFFGRLRPAVFPV